MNNATALEGVPDQRVEPRQTTGQKSEYSEPSTAQIVAYAVPALPTAFFYAPLWVILPAVYVKYFGVELTAVAAVIFYARFFDAIADVVMGYLSDRHRIAGGSRKTWVTLGGLGMMVVCYFLLSPPAEVTVSYYCLWSLAFFFVFTAVTVPQLSWGSELTLDYNRRAKVYTTYSMCSGIGGALFYAIPLLPFYETSDFTPEILTDMVYLGWVIMLCALLWMYVYAPKGVTVQVGKKDSVKLLLQSIFQNKPLSIFFCAYGSYAMSIGMWFGLLFLYLDSYLGRSELLAISMLIGIIAGVLMLPLWQLLISKTSKVITWVMSSVLLCVAYVSFLFVGADAPGWMICLLIGTCMAASQCSNTCSAAILGDIIDYGKLSFRQDRGGTYFAAYNLALKLGLGFGGGLSLAIAGWYGVDVSAAIQSESAVTGLKLGFVYIPLLCALVSMVFILVGPINKQRHSVISKRLEQFITRGTE